MKDVEFISILLLVILEGKIVGFPQSNLDTLYEKYNEIIKKMPKLKMSSLRIIQWKFMIRVIMKIFCRNIL